MSLYRFLGGETLVILNLVGENVSWLFVHWAYDVYSRMLSVCSLLSVKVKRPGALERF